MPKVSEEHFIRRRAQILEAAKKVFSRKGYEPVTMQDIVEESGMSRGGVYQYFSSTEEMMRALMEENTSKFEEYVESLIKTNEKIWDALQSYLHEVESEAEDPFSMAAYEYFVTGWRTEERQNYMSWRYGNGQKIFLRLFEEGVRRGEFVPRQSLEAITRFFINVNDGIALEATLLNGKQIGVAEQIQSLKFYLKEVLSIKD
ncbi:TetR/AcrR family transcriptional regulator [Sporolactobacillus shoreae]|uniref:TetR/AcrR family transcriptional regulator n=1 Tax=Sporolactobacillus shoreae TaxID=1465501 RepID=A0A4Z0GRW4_9BACL|nr:TetR family transcriptional regulator [Sporolactobacillus shoreae]TGB00154.1 TetR/AcrR family transcriptional regulator [Sporolactobacillus shoreae]